jgi:protocatechuate 3,4-dioxygenase alpha subunit
VSEQPLGVTPSQTIGPFFSPGMLRDDARRNVLLTAGLQGQRIRIEGTVLDGDGAPVPDAMVEIWQANAHGRFRHPEDTRDLPLEPGFSGYGRSGSEPDGIYWFETVKPGPVPFDSDILQAPHLSVTVFARGLLNHLSTRMYFADEPANAIDPILQRVPAERRKTLLGTPRQVDGVTVYRWNIFLQGPNETVFFNFAW